MKKNASAAEPAQANASADCTVAHTHGEVGIRIETSVGMHLLQSGQIKALAFVDIVVPCGHLLLYIVHCKHG